MADHNLVSWLRKGETTGRRNINIFGPSPPYIPSSDRKVISYAQLRQFLKSVARRYPDRIVANIDQDYDEYENGYDEDSNEDDMIEEEDHLHYIDQELRDGRAFLFYVVMWPTRKKVGIDQNFDFDPLTGVIDFGLPLILGVDSIMIDDFNRDPKNRVLLNSSLFVNPRDMSPISVHLDPEIGQYARARAMYNLLRLQSTEQQDQFIMNFRMPTIPRDVRLELYFKSQYEMYVYDMDSERDRDAFIPILQNIENIYNLYKEESFLQSLWKLELDFREYSGYRGRVRPNSKVSREMVMDAFVRLRREEERLRKERLIPLAGGKEGV